MSNDGAFSKFIKEFGSKEEDEEDEEKAKKKEGDDDGNEKKPEEAYKHGTVGGPGIMQVEERNTGAISREIYKEYLKAGKGAILLPLLLLSLVLIQATTVMSSYWFVLPLVPLMITFGFGVYWGLIDRLVYWQETKWPLPASFYVSLLQKSITGFNEFSSL
jgi:hypothetical protein